LGAVELLVEQLEKMKVMAGTMKIKETGFAQRINGDYKEENGINLNLLDDRKEDHFKSGQIKGYHFYATDRIAVARYLAAMG
jgi:hypothetical protein